jgi:outer membrane protein assembly factor BamB
LKLSIRNLRWVLLALILTLTLTGCSGRRLGSTSWPGVVVNGNIAYIAYGQEFFAVDPDGQEEIWRLPAEDDLDPQVTYYAPLAVTDGLLVVGGYDSVLYGVDRETQAISWNFNRATGRYIGGPVVEGDRVYAATAGNELFALNLEALSELGAVDKADENRRNRETAAVEWEFQAEQGFWSAPLLAGDALYIGSLDHYVYALASENGDLLWKTELPGAIAGTPLLSEDGSPLYVGNFDYHLYALDPATGDQLWQVEAANWVWGEPVQVGNLLYFGDLDGFLYAVQAKTGELVWSQQLADAIRSGPTYDPERNILYVTARKEISLGGGVTRGLVLALDLETNEILWERPTTDAIYTSPVPLGDMLLVAPAQGDVLLHVLDVEKGAVEWDFTPHAEE